MPFAAPCQGLLPSNSTRRRIGFWFAGLWKDAASGFTSPGQPCPLSGGLLPPVRFFAGRLGVPC